MLEGVLEQLAEDQCEGGRSVARQRDRLEVCADLFAGGQALHEHRAQSLQELA